MICKRELSGKYTAMGVFVRFLRSVPALCGLKGELVKVEWLVDGEVEIAVN
jgi:hypothetical protein